MGTCSIVQGLNLVLGGDRAGWDTWVVGGRSKREGIYVYVCVCVCVCVCVYVDDSLQDTAETNIVKKLHSNLKKK